MLFDTNHSRCEIRATHLRTRGVDVICAKDIREARFVWQANVYRLVLLDAAGSPEVVEFRDAIREANPEQAVAFLVGKPLYLADAPIAEPLLAPEPVLDNSEDTLQGRLANACKDLKQRNGFAEAAFRISIIHSMRRSSAQAQPDSRSRPFSFAQAVRNANCTDR